MDANELLHIDELARLGGVTRRTVRYYVQRGLLPGPEGLGRGAMYRASHLAQLRRVRDLQASGVPLAEIERIIRHPEQSLESPPVLRLAPAVLSRFQLAPGVSLEVQAGALPPDVAAELAAGITEWLARSGTTPKAPPAHPASPRDDR